MPVFSLTCGMLSPTLSGDYHRVGATTINGSPLGHRFTSWDEQCRRCTRVLWRKKILFCVPRSHNPGSHLVIEPRIVHTSEGHKRSVNQLFSPTHRTMARQRPGGLHWVLLLSLGVAALVSPSHGNRGTPRKGSLVTWEVPTPRIRQLIPFHPPRGFREAMGQFCPLPKATPLCDGAQYSVGKEHRALKGPASRDQVVVVSGGVQTRRPSASWAKKVNSTFCHESVPGRHPNAATAARERARRVS